MSIHSQRISGTPYLRTSIHPRRYNYSEPPELQRFTHPCSQACRPTSRLLSSIPLYLSTSISLQLLTAPSIPYLHATTSVYTYSTPLDLYASIPPMYEVVRSCGGFSGLAPPPRIKPSVPSASEETDPYQPLHATHTTWGILRHFSSFFVTV